MGRKKSTVAKVFGAIGRAIGWLIVNFFKAIWYLLSGLALAIYAGVRSVAGKAKEVRSEAQVRREQPKVPSKYTELKAPSTIKGDIATFEQRLLSESLIIAVAGRRGSGKSVLGFRIMENINAKASRPCFVLGVKQSVLPSWIHTIEDIAEVQNGGVVLVDEGAIAFNSRESMSKKNKGLGELLAIARHKDLTLIFITQNTGMIDKNVLNLCDTILLKEGSLLQEKMERSVMKELYTTANEALSGVPADERKSHCYVFDSDFEGLLSVPLPSFWNVKVSKNQA